MNGSIKIDKARIDNTIHMIKKITTESLNMINTKEHTQKKSNCKYEMSSVEQFNLFSLLIICCCVDH